MKGKDFAKEQKKTQKQTMLIIISWQISILYAKPSNIMQCVWVDSFKLPSASWITLW